MLNEKNFLLFFILNIKIIILKYKIKNSNIIFLKLYNNKILYLYQIKKPNIK